MLRLRSKFVEFHAASNCAKQKATLYFEKEQLPLSYMCSVFMFQNKDD